MTQRDGDAAHFNADTSGVIIERLDTSDRDVSTEAQRWTTGERGPIVDDPDVFAAADLTTFVTEAMNIGAHALSATGLNELVPSGLGGAWRCKRGLDSGSSQSVKPTDLKVGATAAGSWFYVLPMSVPTSILSQAASMGDFSLNDHIGEGCAVDDVDYHSAVGDALLVLIGGLTPFVERVTTAALPPGVGWTELLRRKDVAAGRRGGVYRRGDLSLMLRVMTERLGDIGLPFTRHLPRRAQNYASELRDVRDRWAHNEKFTAAEAYRAIDTAELLLRAIGEEAEAAQVAQLMFAVSPPSGTKQPVDPAPDVAGAQQVRFAPTSVPTDPPLPKPTAVDARIQIHGVADLSYAMAHCRIPVIDHITVDNTADDLRSALVEVDVISADGSHSGPQEVFLDLAAHKPAILRNVNLKLDPTSIAERLCRWLRLSSTGRLGQAGSGNDRDCFTPARDLLSVLLGAVTPSVHPAAPTRRRDVSVDRDRKGLK